MRSNFFLRSKFPNAKWSNERICSALKMSSFQRDQFWLLTVTRGISRQVWQRKPRTHFHNDWFHWFHNCSDCRGGPDSQAGAEEGPHCPADGQAQVQEEGPEAPRLRQPVWRHRDEGPGGLWDQQVGGLFIFNSFMTCIQFLFYYVWFDCFFFIDMSQPHWATFLAQTGPFLMEAVY